MDDPSMVRVLLPTGPTAVGDTVLARRHRARFANVCPVCGEFTTVLVNADRKVTGFRCNEHGEHPPNPDAGTPVYYNAVPPCDRPRPAN